MKVIHINGNEYQISGVYSTKRAFGQHIGIHIQLQVLQNGREISKEAVPQYVMEKIEEYVVDLI